MDFESRGHLEVGDWRRLGGIESCWREHQILPKAALFNQYVLLWVRKELSLFIFPPPPQGLPDFVLFSSKKSSSFCAGL